MSHEPNLLTSDPRRWPPSLASQFSKTLTQEGPKWNAPPLAHHPVASPQNPAIDLSLLATDHSSLTTAVKTAPRKLEFRITLFYSGTSKFLIDNFQRNFANSSSLPARSHNSNRHTYEKLEVGLSLLPSAKVLSLIDTKMHFIQGGCHSRPVGSQGSIVTGGVVRAYCF